MATVWVAMSGGVDSSVAAARLVADGHDVTGVTMQILPEGDEPGSCCSTDSVRSAKRVCDLLGVPHYTLNLRDRFAHDVVEPFLDEYARGRTPNPCIECNDRVKFDELLRRARMAGAEFLATGHYARVERDEQGAPWLARGLDRSKDQSYFLYRLTVEQLDRVWFPVGDSAKDDIRAEAAGLGLPTAARPDSQEVCFVPGDAGAFVASRRPRAAVAGAIVDATGAVLGQHEGIARYTVGQRKGLGLAGGPWYVTEVCASDNTIVVAAGAPEVISSVELTRLVWRSSSPSHVHAQIRYRARSVGAGVALGSGECATLTFDQPVGGVAPGQAIVCYAGDRVVGGGVVERTS